MKKKIIGILLVISISFLLLTGCSSGDYTIPKYINISGTITDKSNDNIPLSNTTVTLNDDKEYITVNNGWFSFYKIPNEGIKIITSKLGYWTEIKTYSRFFVDQVNLNIPLMNQTEYFGSISGYIALLSGAIDTNPYSDVKVMATIKDVTTNSTTYWIVSDITDVYPDGYYKIYHAKIKESLTIIGFIDSNDNDIIDNNEFFGKYESTITLNNREDKTDIDIILQPE